jgi:iron-sulfur cluster repair protein YtfE (RIC family)
MAQTKLRFRKATALLKEDHQKVKKLFAEYEKGGEGQAEIFETIKRELAAHAQVEEEIFYPAIQTSDDEEASHLVREAFEEHRVMKTFLEEMSALTPGDEDFDAKMKVLKDTTLHHVEEEQDEIFPIFDKLPKDARDEVSEQLASRKRELESDVE